MTDILVIYSTVNSESTQSVLYRHGKLFWCPRMINCKTILIQYVR